VAAAGSRCASGCFSTRRTHRVTRSRIVTISELEPRFEFGANWARFLDVLTPERLVRAEQSLTEMLGVQNLNGCRFLDVGCGSGLFSLAARRLGAEVVSFDFDPLSVACARELKRRYCPDDGRWQVAEGSVLDPQFVEQLGTFDVVYSWGVLHHTGQMWRAISETARRTAPDGKLFIAIYNDQGMPSRWWTRVKRTYVRLPRVLRYPYLLMFATALEAGAIGTAVLRLDARKLVRRWMQYESVRGMSRWHDLIDWIGGYPFEVATPEAVFDFCRQNGFKLVRLRTCGGRMGCNEFVFERER
jgi:2-polyprenyl-3-methyl-5-hydroxy-6-metoxy-1,4-benzoquinol methylase